MVPGEGLADELWGGVSLILPYMLYVPHIRMYICVYTYIFTRTDISFIHRAAVVAQVPHREQTYLPGTYAHPPLYFKVALDYLSLTQCKCYVNTWAVLLSES